MGCEISKNTASSPRGTTNSRRNTVVAKPSAAVHVGEGIKLADKDETKIVFIFGITLFSSFCVLLHTV